MSLKISNPAPFAALLLLFAMASPALAEDGSSPQVSSFGEVNYKALDPIQLGKEAKPLYKVDAYFKLKDLREIAARDKGTYIVPSKADQEPTELGKDPKPVYDVGAYFRLKDLREIGSKEKKGFLVPSKIRA